MDPFTANLVLGPHCNLVLRSLTLFRLPSALKEPVMLCVDKESKY